MPEYEAANNIGIFLSMPTGEVKTDGIVRHALQAGKKVYVPYLYKRRAQGGTDLVPSMDMASLHSQEDYSALERDKWGIPSLNRSSLRERILCIEENEVPRNGDLDVILMPGIAFDTSMGRIGHGMGYYDRFIAAYCGVRRLSRFDTKKDGFGEESSMAVRTPRLCKMLCRAMLYREDLTYQSSRLGLEGASASMGRGACF